MAYKKKTDTTKQKTKKNLKPWQFQEGNQLWRLRTATNTVLYTPDELLEGFSAYLNWCEKNPIYKYDVIKGGKFSGEVIKTPVPRMRSEKEFCLFLGIARSTYENYKTINDYLEVTKCIKEFVENQQLQNATVGNYKENIIARLLGLVDKKESTNTNYNLNFDKQDENL